MNRLLLCFLMLMSINLSGQQAEDIFIEVPATTNDVLLRRAERLNPAKLQAVRKLLGTKFLQKNATEGLQEIIHVQSSKQIEICVDTTAITGNFGSLNDLSCSILSAGSVSLDANCFTYAAQTGIVVGRDTICVELCDKDNNCTELIYPIEIRNPIPLPFFEDFSTSNIVPNRDIWQNTDVFVNNTIGIQPPSIGMATFDGLDSDGKPYGGGHGQSDQLTSTFIDLDAFSAADDIYMRFWIQPRGFGDRPEKIDSLTLEFKTESGVWNTVKQYDGVPLDTPSTKFFSFVQESIQLIDEIYFHDGFQFRFTNYSTNSGAIDLWHVDYITIAPNQTADPDLKDIAFTRVPESIINRYSSIPWKHFAAGTDELLRDSFRIELFNHFNQTAEARSSFVLIDELVTNTGLPNTGEDLLIPGQENIPPNTAIRFDNPVPFFSDYKTSIENDFDGNDSLIFQVSYGFDQNDEEGSSLDNNRATRTTAFDNYFAYDDGSAETNIIAQNSGTEIGIEFETYVADSLRAIAISFINVKSIDLSRELFNLKVYFDSLQTDPVLENILLKPIFVNTLFDTIQSFSTYALTDPTTGEPMALAIPADTKFYIAFQTVSDNEIPIGFDRNSLEAADRNFVALSTGWFSFPTNQQGAVMMRPIFGDTTPQSSNTVSNDPILPATEIMEIYPNPTSGLMNFQSEGIDITTLDYMVFNTLGQAISHGRLSAEVNFAGLPEGVYYLQLFDRKKTKSYNHKFIVAR